LFSSLAVGRSTTNRLVYNDDGGEGGNFKITYCLNKGDVVYLRIRGYNWITTGTFAFSVASTNHTHVYNSSYSKYSSDSHRAYCCCGVYIYENHDYYGKLGQLVCKHCGYSTGGIVPVPDLSIGDDVINYSNERYYLPYGEE
jgi:hypothetical protein